MGLPEPARYAIGAKQEKQLQLHFHPGRVEFRFHSRRRVTVRHRITDGACRVFQNPSIPGPKSSPTAGEARTFNRPMESPSSGRKGIASLADCSSSYHACPKRASDRDAEGRSPRPSPFPCHRYRGQARRDTNPLRSLHLYSMLFPPLPLPVLFPLFCLPISSFSCPLSSSLQRFFLAVPHMLRKPKLMQVRFRPSAYAFKVSRVVHRIPSQEPLPLGCLSDAMRCWRSKQPR